MKNMTDIDVLAVTMLEPEAVNIDILYFHSIYTSHIYISILCFYSTQSIWVKYSKHAFRSWYKKI